MAELVSRTVNFSLKKPNGTPEADKDIFFAPKEVAPGENFISSDVDIVGRTNANGTGSVTLFTYENSYLNYYVEWDGSGGKLEFTLADESGALDLGAALSEAIESQNLRFTPATEERLGAVKPDGTTITIDADGTIHAIGGSGGSASGPAGGVLSGNYPNPGFAVNMVEQSELNNALTTKADLVGGKVPAAQLPSFVDDVLEFVNLAAFPVTGETGKIFVALDTNKTYRWSGSVYVEISPSSGSSSTGYALKFTPGAGGLAGGNNVNHGYFWRRNEAHGHFFWEAWVQPLAGAEYWVSDGHGGAHALLAGFLASSTESALSGNVWDKDTSTLTTFNSIDKVRIGTLVHYAIGWDGDFLYLYLNGVLTGKTAFTGERGNGGSGPDGILYIGGSDHSNFSGWIYRIRAFEDQLPFADGFPNYFRPEKRFRGAFAIPGDNTPRFANFLADYTTPSPIIADTGSGYGGGTHPGVLSVGNDYANFKEGLNQNDSALPIFEQKPFEQTEYLGDAPGSTSGWLLYDDFNRRDRVPAWENPAQIVLTAPTGQVWLTDDKIGILSGKLVPLSNSAINVWIDSTVSDVDATFTNGNPARRLSTYFRANNSFSEKLAVVIELNQGLYDISVIKIGGSGAGYLATEPGALSASNFTTMRIVAKGGNVDVYVDNVLKLEATGITHQTGTYVGVSFEALDRLEKITAKAAL